MRKLTTDEFIERAIRVHGEDHYDYSAVEYINSYTKITIKCNICTNIWQSTPNSHMQGNGCAKCALKNSQLSNEDFLARATKLFGNDFDYLEAYTSSIVKIKIRCNKHNKIFYMTPSCHLSGHGCSGCKSDKIRSSKLGDLTSFLDKAKGVHGDTYDYSLFIYVDSVTKGIIICSEHGQFEQNPHNHLIGHGCPKCSNKLRGEALAKSTASFIEDAIKVHGDEYDYSNTKYINAKTNVVIICKTHGEFLQLPTHHLNGGGCPKCVNIISALEVEWLDYLGIPEEYRQGKIKIGKSRFKPDAFDPITNTVYEFNGDYWHGNPSIYDPNEMNYGAKKTFGELYEKTMRKEKVLLSDGYNVISIWESDWNKIKHGL